jgi:hypothetical protein
VATFFGKIFKPKILKWQKVYHQEKNWKKVHIGQITPTLLKAYRLTIKPAYWI